MLCIQPNSEGEATDGSKGLSKALGEEPFLCGMCLPSTASELCGWCQLARDMGTMLNTLRGQDLQKAALTKKQLKPLRGHLGRCESRALQAPFRAKDVRDELGTTLA